jgi:peptide/nickel transport system substrate-binding protein
MTGVTGVTGTASAEGAAQLQRRQGDILKHTHGHASWHRIIAVFLALVFVAAACGDDGDDGNAGGDGGTDDATTTTGDGPERNPVKGGELIFGTESDVATLAPGEAAQPSDKVITLGIYDPLTTYVDGKIEPFLAETIEGNDDLTQYTITLREGVTFHDDTPLNADAVVKHFDRLKDPATACPCQTTIAIIESMEMPDGPEGLSVVFNLGTASVAFPDTLAGSSGYIESPTAVANGINLKTDGVGTGPFELESFTAGESTVLTANPDYWGTDEAGTQLPYLDKLTIVPIPDSGQRVAALETGDIDIFQTADSKTVKQAEDKGFAAQKISGSSSTIILMNNAKPPFDDVRARQALAYAIDKDLINERAYDGVRVPSYSGFALDSAYYNPDAGTPQYDPEKAAELVEELGGLKFSFVCIPTPEADLILNIIKQQGEEVGMEIELQSQEQGAFVNRMFSKGGDYEAACFRSSHFIEPDAIRPGLTTDDAGNLAFYSNPDVDRLLDEARQTDDFDERKAAYDEVQAITGEEVPLITTLYDLFGNVYDDSRVGPPPDGEPNSLGAIKPGLLYATEG